MPYFGLVLFFILLDQFTKIWVKGFNLLGWNHEGFYLGESVTFIDGFIYFTFVENPGMAFGISFGDGKIFLSLFSIVASILLGILIYKIKNSHKAVLLGFSFIMAGATGNLIDRVFYGVFYNESPIFYGKVVDFIQFNIPDISIGSLEFTHFPVFNVADSCVTIGLFILLFFQKHIPDFSTSFSKKKNIDQEQ
ncbi:MAG: lipoprotein signal peptidase [Candidatus Kapaibacteriales bacterium]